MPLGEVALVLSGAVAVGWRMSASQHAISSELVFDRHNESRRYRIQHTSSRHSLGTEHGEHSLGRRRPPRSRVLVNFEALRHEPLVLMPVFSRWDGRCVDLGTCAGRAMLALKTLEPHSVVCRRD